MAKGKNQHVVPKDDKWASRTAGNERATRLFRTQAEAFDFARERARKLGSEVRIHGRNGRIRRSHSYGNDPYPPKG